MPEWDPGLRTHFCRRWQSRSRLQLAGVADGMQVPKQFEVVQAVENGAHVSVSCEHLVTVLDTRHADVGPGGTEDGGSYVVMQAPCHGRPGVEYSVGVQISGLEQVGVPSTTQDDVGCCGGVDVVMHTPCHGRPAVEDSVGVQMAGAEQLGVPLTIQLVGCGPGKEVQTPCHG